MTDARQPRLAGVSLGRDLVWAVLAAALCTVVVLAIPVTPVRVVFAIPLCLLLPGYAIRSALFGQTQLEPAARMMLVPALSVVALILSGLLLNEFPGGIQKGTWAGWLMFVIVVAAVIADRRRRTQGGAPIAGLQHQIRLRRGDVIVLGAALALAVGAYVATRQQLAAKNVVGYETLTMLPSAGNRGVTLTAKSGREHTYDYTVDASVGSRRVLHRTLKLTPGESYILHVGVPAATTARQVSAQMRIDGLVRAPTQRVNLSLPAAK